MINFDGLNLSKSLCQNVESAHEIGVLWCGLCISLIKIAKKMRNPCMKIQQFYCNDDSRSSCLQCAR